MKPDGTKMVNDYKKAIDALLIGVDPQTFEERNAAISKVWQVRSWDVCQHETKVNVRSMTSNDKIQIRQQCVYCGHLGQALSQQYNRADVEKVDFSGWMDEMKEIQKAAVQQIEYTFEMNRRKNYDGYLQSEAWRAKTRLVLMRDNNACRAQLPGCMQRATDVHHLNYTYFGNEPLFTLTSVCRSCHDKITQMEGRHKR